MIGAEQTENEIFYPQKHTKGVKKKKKEWGVKEKRIT